eukprot:11827476-Alexandrium_andersonii.AAC.1
MAEAERAEQLLGDFAEQYPLLPDEELPAALAAPATATAAPTQQGISEAPAPAATAAPAQPGISEAPEPAATAAPVQQEPSADADEDDDDDDVVLMDGLTRMLVPVAGIKREPTSDPHELEAALAVLDQSTGNTPAKAPRAGRTAAQ